MRIASLISAGTEMLYALGLGPQVVAVSHECDWPEECRRLPRVTRSNVNSHAPSGAIDLEVRELLSRGQPLYEIDVEGLTELRPDLIVTQAQCDVCAVRYADVLAAVKSEPQLTGTRVISLNPQSLEDVFDDMLRIAAAADAAVQGEQVVKDLRRPVKRVRDASDKIPASDRPRVAMIEWTDPLMLAGNWVPQLVEIAGGSCGFTPSGQHSQVCAWDDFLTFDPQIIVICPCGFDQPRAVAETKLLVERPGWSKLSAVKNARVFPIDGNAYFNRPGPQLVDSLELLAGFIQDYHAASSRVPSPK
jgi:iron complex transport system substrate-binding protein